MSFKVAPRYLKSFFSSSVCFAARVQRRYIYLPLARSHGKARLRRVGVGGYGLVPDPFVQNPSRWLSGAFGGELCGGELILRVRKDASERYFPTVASALLRVCPFCHSSDNDPPNLSTSKVSCYPEKVRPNLTCFLPLT
jgi:hypothetical protein